MIITIGRQLGSGGREIGKRLSEALNIACYDKEIIEITARESGLNRQLFEQADECARKHILSDIFGMRFPYGSDTSLNDGLSNDALFRIQSDVIRSLADRQSCVFIGRCADYILRDRNDCLNIFICANNDDRIRRISESYSLPLDKARDLMESADKKRAAFYNYYSNKVWGAADSYHICIDSSVFGIERTVALIREMSYSSGVNRM